MRRYWSIHVLLILALAGCALTWAGVPAAWGLLVRHGQKQNQVREIQSLEEEWRAAQLSSDVSLMDRLLSDDYVGISITGQVNTKQQQLDRLRTRAMVLTQIDQTDVKVKLVGRVAIVTSLATVAGSNDGTPFQGLFRSTRIYQRVGPGMWKLTNFEATRVPQGEAHEARQESTALEPVRQ